MRCKKFFEMAFAPALEKLDELMRKGMLTPLRSKRGCGEIALVCEESLQIMLRI